MLVTLKFTKGRHLFYKIRSKQVGENIIIYAPKPKTKGKKARLKKVLYPYAGQIIYPKDFDLAGFPVGFDLKAAVRRKKLQNFLKVCKEKRPKTAVIMQGDLIRQQFFKDISPFVGKIILPLAPFDADLQNDLLAFSGTPVIFGGEVPKSDDETAILLL